MLSTSQGGTALVRAARLPHKQAGTLWDIDIHAASAHIASITPHDSSAQTSSITTTVDAHGRLCALALCHAHVHLDKCHLLHSPAYADLRITKGTFDEAMSLTGAAKARFTESDLLSRGRRLLRESVDAGVTSMRAFVEVDEVVQLKCVHAGLALKSEFAARCHVQICVFAQLPLFTSEHAAERRRLLEEAVRLDGVDVVGSTPYVEEDVSKMKECVQYTIAMAVEHAKHLDFHLDYNVDGEQDPLVWYVVEQLAARKWGSDVAKGMTVCLGHCTRLTMFAHDEWQNLKEAIGDLPVSFIGLPTSDLFMQGRQKGGSRPRATLQIPEMITEHRLQGAISINNVGNAFTPFGSCDPLVLASLGVGVYQTGTEQDAELLYECVSSRAARAIGIDTADLDMQVGQRANLILFAEGAAQDTSGLQLPHLVYTPYTVHREVILAAR